MSEVGSPSCLDDDGMPTLTQLNLGYLHMNEIRNVIHAKDKNKMFGVSLVSGVVQSNNLKILKWKFLFLLV